MYEKRDLLGIILFGVAIVILLSMFISPISKTFIHVDEYWTYTLVNLPFIDGMKVAFHDVHPPLYYMILYLLTPLGLDNLYLLKVVSVIPYILTMIVAATKIRKDYGWLTAGLFVFCLGIMSDFYVEFLTIRMYSWGLFFVLMAFIYFNEVMTKWDRKSWILLTLFTLLAAYTQYFFAITCALMYLLILVEILTKHKDRLRQFGKSVLALIILYAPWGLVFIRQISTEAAGSHEGFEMSHLIHYLLGFAIKAENFRTEMVIYKLIALVFLVLILYLIYTKKDKFAASGIFLMYATIGIGIASLMFSFENTMRIRYLVPVFALFWLSASMVIGKIENKKVLLVALILVMILAVASLTITNDDINSRLKTNEEKFTFIDSINNNSTVIVYNTDYGYRILHEDFDKAKQYSVSDTYFYSDDVEICKDLDKILNQSSGKNVYLINWKNTDKNKKYEDGYNLAEKYDAGHYVVYLVNGTSTK